MNRRQQLEAIFVDTEDMISSNITLKEAARASAGATKVYEPDDWPELGAANRTGAVRVSERRSFEAARAILGERPDAHVCVHNFASSVFPGGGVRNGASAQEESLCRCSTLLSSLDQKRIWDKFYSPNRGSGSALATDACIWSPNVVVFKSDTALPERLPQEEWLTVDVVTCAAPDLRRTSADLAHPMLGHKGDISLTELYDIHRQRARHLLTICAAEGIDCLVLGAFGCGAFRNDPYLVANAWHQEVDAMRKHFDLIEFAVFHMPYELDNYEAFRDEFAQMD